MLVTRAGCVAGAGGRAGGGALGGRGEAGVGRCHCSGRGRLGCVRWRGAAAEPPARPAQGVLFFLG